MNYAVLLVDDDHNLLDALQRLLHQEPYRILTAQSAEEAFEILQAHSVDVVISDHEMPGLKGTQFLWKVKNLYPDTILMMLTGQATRHVAKIAMNDIGIVRLLHKPCDPFDLAMTIRQALRHRELMINARRLLEIVQKQEAMLKQISLEFPEALHNRTGTSDEQHALKGTPKDEGSLIQAMHQAIKQFAQHHPHTPPSKDTAADDT